MYQDLFSEKTPWIDSHKRHLLTWKRPPLFVEVMCFLFVLGASQRTKDRLHLSIQLIQMNQRTVFVIRYAADNGKVLRVMDINFLLTISRQSREKVVRINWLITNGKCFDLLSNSLNWFFKEMYGDQSGEFVCGYWGLNKVDKYHGWIPRKALHQLFLSFHADSLQTTFQTFYPQPSRWFWSSFFMRWVSHKSLQWIAVIIIIIIIIIIMSLFIQYNT